MRDLGTSLCAGSAVRRSATPSAECVVTVSTASPDCLTQGTAEALSRALDGNELSRLTRLKDDDARRQYVVAHVLLRTALSAQYPAMPSEWRFRRTPTGESAIVHPPEAAALFFSLSHTRSLVVCAVSATCRVGVDAERVEAGPELAQLAPHVLSEDERNEWAQAGLTTRGDRFYRLWTLKEALLKAVGRGLRTPPSCVGFRLPDGLPPELACLPPELGDRREWSFRTLGLSAMHVCSLAVRIPPDEPLRVQWRNSSVGELAEHACCLQPVTPVPYTAPTAGVVRRTA
jgi:4'-phosphopantetheinyl transferase